MVNSQPLVAVLPQHQRVSDHIFARGCATDGNGMLHTCADITKTDELVEVPTHLLSECSDLLAVEIILDVGVVGCVIFECDEEHVQAGLLHREMPAKLRIIIRRSHIVPAEVLARITVGAVPDPPVGAVVVRVIIVETMAERGFAVVVQHGHVVAEAGLNPVAGVDLALREGE